MTQESRNQIKGLITKAVTAKLEKYTAETQYRPYFQALFDNDVIVQASIMQSLYTTFGMSIYEQMAIILARQNGLEVQRQYLLRGCINDATIIIIDKICAAPIGTQSKQEEVEALRRVSSIGEASTHPDSTVDVFIKERDDGTISLIDITSVKPNKKESRALRRKLLFWTALVYSQDPNANVNTFIGMPYNPYYPDEYSRSFVLDNCHKSEILVQNDLWRLFAGYDVFDEMIEVFKEVGNDLSHEIRRFLNQEQLEISDGSTN